MDPYRRVLYNTFKQLNENQFKLVKLFVSQSIPNGDILETSSIVDVCLALENTGQISPPDKMDKLKEYFELVNRKDLIQDIDVYLMSLKENSEIVEIDQRQQKNNLTAMLATLTSVVGLLLAYCYEFFSGHNRGWLYTLLAVGVVFIALMLNKENIWYNYRYYRCTHGSVPGSLLHFQFTTFDLQDADVEDCVEFTWDAMKKKFGVTFEPHPSDGFHYFLNTNRAILGDVRRVGNLMDGTKPVRGAEIFAVPKSCDSVWFHTDSGWKPYSSARKIVCQFNGKIMTSIKGLRGDKSRETTYPPKKDYD